MQPMKEMWWFVLFMSGIEVLFAVGVFSQNELTSLHDFYNSTNGLNWRWLKPFSVYGTVWNFTGSPNPCNATWQGILCQYSVDNMSHVRSLVLNSYGLDGTIPMSISNLSHLQTFGLRGNFIRGSIPSSLTTLKFLKNIDLSDNEIVTAIVPEWANVTSLVNIDFSDALFIRAIPNLSTLQNLTSLLIGSVVPIELIFAASFPGFVCDMPKLTAFNFDYWRFRPYSIPSCIFGMTQLKAVSLSLTNMVGTIPVELNNLHNLEELGLDLNTGLNGSINNLKFNNFLHLRVLTIGSTGQLTGTLPPELFNCRNLTVIDLGENMLTGTFPPGIEQLQNLTQFYIGSNYFLEGTIPSEIGLLPRLRELGVAGNSFTGDIFPWTEQLQYLELYQAEVNQFSGSITDVICSGAFRQLYVYSNHITGALPDCSGPHLEFYSIYDNHISGSIPQSFKNMPALVYLFAYNNLLSGQIPYIANSPILEYLLLQNNILSGSLSGIINPNQRFLGFVDVSGNRLTSSLPPELFNISTLASFAAASNCITGSLPQTICASPALTFLDLDGLHTAPSCQVKFFSSLKRFQSYRLSHKIDGEIPACIFASNSIHTLHISGNAIDWTFPSDLVLGQNLTTLSLSHNNIRGSIPSVIQYRVWDNLDLSFNKLNGILQSDFASKPSTILKLKNNRLSGGVPRPLKILSQIDILEGNLIDCGLYRDSLPVNDTSFKTYQCGSVPFNESFLTWGIVFVMALTAVGVTVFNARHAPTTWLGLQSNKAASAVRDYLTMFIEGNKTVDNKHIVFFAIFLATLRSIFFRLTLVVVCLMLPLYCLLTQYFYTINYQYAYTVSAAYLQGSTAAAVLFVTHTALIVYTIYQFLARFVNNQRRYNVKTTEKITGHIRRMHQLRLAMVTLFNCVVMIVVNGGYVYVLLEYSAVVVSFATLAISLFKLIWNDFAIRGMVSFVRRFYFRDILRTNIPVDQRYEETRDMSFLTFIVIFNSIVAPCIANSVVEPKCFLNVFIAPLDVTSSFPFAPCSPEELQAGTCSALEVNESENVLSTTYQPPFIYSYQCTSSFVTNYASVYVYMFLFVAFIKPVLLLVFDYAYSHQANENTITYRVLNNILYILMKPARPTTLTTPTILFHKERFVLRTASKLAIFVTFGVVFPPLAVVIFVALYVETYVNQLIMGRYLFRILEGERHKYAKLIGDDVKGTSKVLGYCLLKLVIPFTAFFYGFFLLDIYGDQVGWADALWMGLLMTCIPAILWILYNVHAYYITSYVTQERPGRQEV